MTGDLLPRGRTCLILGLLLLAFAVFVFGDVLLGARPPYLYDPGGKNLTLSQWLDGQRALRWLWGGRAAWDVAPWIRAVWFLGVAALLVWKAPARRIRAWMTARSEGAAGRDVPRRRVPTVVILLAAAAVLWTFRSRDLRYGDSAFLTDLVPRETASRGANIAYEEILDCVLHCRLYHHLNRLFGLDIVTVFNLIGIGMSVIGLALVWPRWRRQAGLPAGLVLMLWIATGWSHLFFGHVEYYTSVAVVLLVYATMAIEHLEREDGPPFWICAFLAGLAVCFHMLAGWIWPTLGVLLWHDVLRRHRPVGRLLLSGGAAFLFPILVSVLVATLYGFPPSLFANTHVAHLKFIFLLTPENAQGAHRAIYQYPFLSIPHIWDIVNELVRVAWPGIVLVAALFPAARRLRLWRKPTVQFWLVAALFLQVFIMVWNPDLGYIRDWDLFGVVALGWTGFGIEWARQVNRHVDEGVCGEEGQSVASGDIAGHNNEPKSGFRSDGELVAMIVLFALATSIPMRVSQMLHHTWWVGGVNSPGAF